MGVADWEAPGLGGTFFVSFLGLQCGFCWDIWFWSMVSWQWRSDGSGSQTAGITEDLSKDMKERGYRKERSPYILTLPGSVLSIHSCTMRHKGVTCAVGQYESRHHEGLPSKNLVTGHQPLHTLTHCQKGWHKYALASHGWENCFLEGSSHFWKLLWWRLHWSIDVGQVFSMPHSAIPVIFCHTSLG